MDPIEVELHGFVANANWEKVRNVFKSLSLPVRIDRAAAGPVPDGGWIPAKLPVTLSDGRTPDFVQWVPEWSDPSFCPLVRHADDHDVDCVDADEDEDDDDDDDADEKGGERKDKDGDRDVSGTDAPLRLREVVKRRGVQDFMAVMRPMMRAADDDGAAARPTLYARRVGVFPGRADGRSCMSPTREPSRAACIADDRVLPPAVTAALREVRWQRERRGEDEIESEEAAAAARPVLAHDVVGLCEAVRARGAEAMGAGAGGDAAGEWYVLHGVMGWGEADADALRHLFARAGDVLGDDVAVQRLLFAGMTSDELLAAGAWNPRSDEEAGGAPAVVCDLDEAGAHPLHPWLRRERWDGTGWAGDASDTPALLFNLDGGRVREWSAWDDRVWSAVQPALQLASRVLEAGHPFLQALMDPSNYRRVDPALDPRSPHNKVDSGHARLHRFAYPADGRYSGPVLPQFERLAAMGVDFAELVGRVMDARLQLVFESNKAERVGDVGYGATLRMDRAILIVLKAEMLWPLVADGFSSTEHAAASFVLAATLLHELAHAVYFALHSLLDDTDFPAGAEGLQDALIDARDLLGGPHEPYFRDEPEAELGYAFENALFGGVVQVLPSMDERTLSHATYLRYANFVLGLDVHPDEQASPKAGTTTCPSLEQPRASYLRQLTCLPVHWFGAFFTRRFWDEVVPRVGIESALKLYNGNLADPRPLALQTPATWCARVPHFPVPLLLAVNPTTIPTAGGPAAAPPTGREFGRPQFVGLHLVMPDPAERLWLHRAVDELAGNGYALFAKYLGSVVRGSDGAYACLLTARHEEDRGRGVWDRRVRDVQRARATFGWAYARGGAKQWFDMAVAGTYGLQQAAADYETDSRERGQMATRLRRYRKYTAEELEAVLLSALGPEQTQPTNENIGDVLVAWLRSGIRELTGALVPLVQALWREVVWAQIVTVDYQSMEAVVWRGHFYGALNDPAPGQQGGVASWIAAAERMERSMEAALGAAAVLTNFLGAVVSRPNWAGLYDGPALAILSSQRDQLGVAAGHLARLLDFWRGDWVEAGLHDPPNWWTLPCFAGAPSGLFPSAGNGGREARARRAERVVAHALVAQGTPPAVRCLLAVSLGLVNLRLGASQPVLLQAAAEAGLDMRPGPAMAELAGLVAAHDLAEANAGPGLVLAEASREELVALQAHVPRFLPGTQLAAEPATRPDDVAEARTRAQDEVDVWDEWRLFNPEDVTPLAWERSNEAQMAKDIMAIRQDELAQKQTADGGWEGGLLGGPDGAEFAKVRARYRAEARKTVAGQSQSGPSTSAP